MNLIAAAAVLALATPAFPQTFYTVSYDTLYDQKEGPLNSVACSTGEFGLISQGYSTFGDLPTFPFIGGAPQIPSWNSPNCGTCWELKYIDPHGVSTSLSFTAINTGTQFEGDFTISFEGLNRLTHGNALTLDGVSVSVSQLSADECGLSNLKQA